MRCSFCGAGVQDKGELVASALVPAYICLECARHSVNVLAPVEQAKAQAESAKKATESIINQMMDDNGKN